MNATLARIRRLTVEPTAAADGPLLDAFLTGDQAAFAVLVRRHAGLVFATCRRILRHQQDAEDAFQATFLVLARRAADVWPREAVGSWLFGVAHRVALKARAVRSRRTVREQQLEDAASTKPAAPADFDLAEAVHRVVCKLPEVYRAAVVACDLEGLSRKEAAERLGWSEGTLSGRLARARELLARRFRRTGLALPAGGLVAVFATTEAVSAATVQTTIDLATGAAAVGASAPVAALTEGVVRSMTLFKLKALTAVVLAACVLGFGAFAATGAGRGPNDVQPGPQAQARTGSGAPGERVAVNGEQPTKPLNVPRPANPTTDRDRLQGVWRVVSLTEGGKTTTTNPKDPWVFEFTGDTLKMPFREAEGWKQREYQFTVEEPKEERAPLRTLDMLKNRKTVVRAIYEFTLPSAQCATCHQHPFADVKLQIPDALAVCWPVFKDQKRMREAGVRLALSTDGTRPAKFGGDGVIVFELKRPDPRDEERAKLVEAQKEYAARIAAAASAEEKRRLEAELAALRARLDDLAAREAEQRAMVELQRAQVELAHAEAAVELARAEAQRAADRVDQAFRNLEAAKVRLKAAEKAVGDAKKPKAPADDAAFIVHVRPLAEAEKVIRVKATGKETVLEGLAYATDVFPVKAGEVSVWLVRDKAVIPVDLPAVLKGGDAKMNYTLKAGDQLFVQVKPGK